MEIGRPAAGVTLWADNDYACAQTSLRMLLRAYCKAQVQEGKKEMTQIYDPVAMRRELHEMPELGLKEVRTSAYVAEKLQALGIETETNVGGTTGVVGYIRGAEPGPVMMLRADMDALPFIVDGKPVSIHACGHDAHTAMLLAAASRLQGKIRRGTLKLAFQPAEEILKGATALIDAGVLDDVDYVLGAHIRPIQDLPKGKLCAAVCHTSSATITIEIHGRSAHASRPHLGVNVIDVSCAVIEGVRAIWLDPKLSWSAKATQIHADAGATNTVPDIARISFDLRSATNALMDELLEKIGRVTEGVCAGYGAEGKVILHDRCPACWYDDDFKAEVADAIRETAGEEALAADCGGGGEDFHNFKLAKPAVKAAYFGVGVGAEPGLHAATMHFDDTLLPMGVAVFENVVLKHLG